MKSELQTYRISQTELGTITEHTNSLPVQLQGAVHDQLFAYTGWGGGKFKQLSVKLYEVTWERYDENGFLVGTYRTPIIQTPQGDYKLQFEYQEIINTNAVRPMLPVQYPDEKSEEKPQERSNREIRPLLPPGYNDCQDCD